MYYTKLTADQCCFILCTSKVVCVVRCAWQYLQTRWLWLRFPLWPMNCFYFSVRVGYTLRLIPPLNTQFPVNWAVRWSPEVVHNIFLYFNWFVLPILIVLISFCVNAIVARCLVTSHSLVLGYFMNTSIMYYLFSNNKNCLWSYFLSENVKITFLVLGIVRNRTLKWIKKNSYIIWPKYFFFV